MPAIEPLGETEQWLEARDQEAREAAAAEWVRRGQREDNAEHLAVLGLDGSLIQSYSSGETSAVYVGDLPAGLDVILHHSHPDEVSLSGSDLAVAWRQSRGSEACAYTPNGIYRGRSLEPPQKWMARRTRALKAVGSELRVLQRRIGGSLAELSAHIVNLELAELGKIWYEYEIAPATQTALDSIANELPNLRTIARNAMKD